MPMQKHTTEIIAEFTITPRNVLQTRIDVSAGNMIKLEISNVPIIHIPSTIVTAVRTAINVLYKSAFTPVAFANISSNVIANILL